MYKQNYTIMGRKKMSTEPDVRWPILMKKKFKEQYKEFCDKNGMSMNKRIKLLMQKDMENGLTGK